MEGVSLGDMVVVCNPVFVRGEAPSPREAHTMLALDPHRILVFAGGSNSMAFGPQQFNDLFLLDLKQSEWLPVQSKGHIPSPRTGQSGVALPDGRCFFFGGSSMAEGYTNEVYVLDSKDWLWSSPQVSGTPPCPRDKQTVCLLGSDLYVFGGFGPAPVHHDDTDNVLKEEEEGSNNEATSSDEEDDDEEDEEEEDGSSMSFTWFNDLYVLDTKSMHWERKESFGDKPSPRAAHAAFIVPCPDEENSHQMVLFGGRDPTGRQNDVFILNLHTLKWSRKFPQTANGNGSSLHSHPPVARSFHVMLSLGRDAQTAVSYGGIGANGELFRGLEVLNLRNMSWAVLTKLKGVWPPLRGPSAMVALASEQANDGVDRLLIFGGSCPSESEGSIYFNDAYSIDIAPLLKLLTQH